MGLSPSSLLPVSPFNPLIYSTLKFYHLFPLHSPVTLFLMDAPWGRFAYPEQRGREGKRKFGDLDGNWAWALMEVVSSLYLTHYLVRSIISPLILAPKRNLQHIWVTASSIFFNLMNGYVMGSFLASDPVWRGATADWTFWLRIVAWAMGFLGNVYHDEILHDLRDRSLLFHHLPWIQSRVDITSTSTAKQDAAISKNEVGSMETAEVREKEKQGARVDDGRGRYKIPRGGLFHWVTMPNYLCEWFEWTCFSLLISPNPFLAIPSTSTSLAAYSSPTRNFISLMSALPFPAHILTPPWMFLVALLTAMVPRAIKAEGWYHERFGEVWMKSGREGGGWSCLPGLV